ncbi:MAG: META domain-containing protein [Actinomycetota bacterium]
MFRRRPHLLLLAVFGVLGLLLAACGDETPDIAVDAGVAPDSPPDGPADDDAAGDSGAAAGGGATRPWIGGDWVLASITVDGTKVAIPDGAVLDLSIVGPDQISGSAGCNSFGGTISAPFDGDADAGALTIGELAITEMACEILDFESTYVDALVAANEWELAPPQGLVFRGDGVELNYLLG